jgi:hypothetical protein
MESITRDWNPKQARLKEMILKQDKFREAMDLALDMHSFVHTSEMSGKAAPTYEDELWKGLDPGVFGSQYKNKGSTIAWNLWHLTRIEDLTANILIAESSQVLSYGAWLDKMKVSVTDTGNAMSDSEIAEFSVQIDMLELRNYRMAVGRKTREILMNLVPKDMKRKVRHESIRRIWEEGGVTGSDQSRWLLDFWGKKTVAGIILMPITRHQVVHINDSLKLKSKIRV